MTDAPELARKLVAGEITFDRAEQVARLPAEERAGHQGHDISGLRRLVAHHKRLTRRRERKLGNGSLNFGSDELVRSFWGELPGIDSRIVEKAVDQRADDHSRRRQVGGGGTSSPALAAICQDSLYDPIPDSEAAPTEVAVIVDARTAAPSNGETGVSVLAGPRIGPRALEEILCDGIIGVVGITADGEPLKMGRRSRTVNRRLRRHVMYRDGSCTVEGCSSPYRLEVHHVTFWSHGGRTDPNDLITVCWFHHHISIHREGMEIHRIGPSRIRLKRPR